MSPHDALTFELLVWTETPNRQFLLKSDLNFLIFEAFQRWQIEIPFSQRDLHLRSVQVAPALRETLSQLSSLFPNGFENSQ
ncbi:hypothetical protein [Leptolyngbya sp. GB1-A1]|uniref:hypothetical protein n=1 Tax=Leptolyngbya sp. GB1-A1 TaxID=2933908 RepID=UPI0032976FFE